MLTAGGKPRPWRTTVLALTLAGVCGVLVKVWVIDPRQSPPPIAPITLPDAPPLPGWTLTESAPIAIDLIPGSRASHVYHFQQGGQPLEIHMHYMAPWTDGNISRFLFVHTPIRTANAGLQQRYHPETGAYGVLTAQGRAYLTACINPKGQSTLTEQQATQNRYATGLRPWRVLRWLLGQDKLWDGRCLWTLMMVRLPPTTPAVAERHDTPMASAQAYQILEAAWVPWHHWWQANFPPPVPE
ncbi:cyanoexosortase A system-associated protein [Trichothermofontia sp.]